MSNVTLMPSAAVDRVCHEEQLRIWAEEVVSALSVHGFLREDLEYHDVVDLHRAVSTEIKSIIRSALNHPEARTVVNLK